MTKTNLKKLEKGCRCRRCIRETLRRTKYQKFEDEFNKIKMKYEPPATAREQNKRITAIEDSAVAPEREAAEYWKDWEKLGQFDEPPGVTEVLRDKNGEIHFLHINVTVDGKLLPKDVGGAWYYFKLLALPYDRNRVGRRFVDRKMSLKKSAENMDTKRYRKRFRSIPHIMRN